MWTPNRWLVALTIAASLLGLGATVGAGAASAGRCNDETFLSDTWVTAGDGNPVGVFVGYDTDFNEGIGWEDGASVCWGASDDTESHERLTFSVSNPYPADHFPVLVSAQRCNDDTGTCSDVVGTTGKETGVPYVWFDWPDGDLSDWPDRHGEGSGVGTGIPDGNCLWIDGQRNCWATANIASAMVGSLEGGDVVTIVILDEGDCGLASQLAVDPIHVCH
ncbi:MAG: hypothetical protein QOF60_329 [Actinomycetota bacterium]|jgi:hypothetical protein|nr:hypothetical protein [Actinomycetota bacterium]